MSQGAGAIVASVGVRSGGRIAVRPALLLMGTTLLVRALMAYWPLFLDEGAYAYTALWWWRGLTLYGPDLTLGRPQGIVLAYLPPVVLAEGSALAIRAWGAVCLGATAVVVSEVTRRLGGVGPVAGLAFAVLSASPFVGGYAINAEMLMVLPATAAVLAMSHGRFGLAGGLVGCAVLLKPSALPLVALAPLFTRRPGLLTRFVAAGAGVGAAALAHGVLTVGLTAYLDAIAGSRVTFRALYGWPAWFAILTSSPAWLGGALAGVVALRAAPAIAAWLALAAVGVVMGGAYFPHYFVQLLPPLCVLVGVAMARCRKVVLWRAVAVIALAWTLMLHTWALRHPDAFFYSWWPMRAEPLAEVLRRHTAPDDTVYLAHNAPDVLYLSGRRSVTRHIYRFNLATIPGAFDEVRARIRAAEPRCVAFVEPLMDKPWLPVMHDDLREIVRELHYRPVPAPAEVWCR